MEKNFLSLIKMRRSVRAYKSEPVVILVLADGSASTYVEGGKDLLREWKLPETLRGVGAIAMGYPAQEAGQPAARKQNYIVRTICGEEGKHADQ